MTTATKNALNEQTFARITTYGKNLVPTDYADGYRMRGVSAPRLA